MFWHRRCKREKQQRRVAPNNVNHQIRQERSNKEHIMKTKFNLFDRLMTAITFAEADVDIFAEERTAGARRHDNANSTPKNLPLMPHHSKKVPIAGLR